MATRGKKTLVQRIALDGDEDIRKGLKALGKDGQAAFNALKKATEDTNKATTGFNAKLLTLRDRVLNVQKAAAKLGDRFKFLQGAVGQFAAAAAAAFSIRELGQAADKYVELQNVLRIVGGEQQNVNDTIGQLAAIANRTRAPLEAIATLYQRTSIAAKELGADQKQILRFTETIGLALAQQGGSAEKASGALLQLSQALGSGVVRAEEFNSILEGAYPIALAAAKGLDEAGGSVAKLRSLVIAGKVSSDAFFKAILSQSTALELAFSKTTPTISQAFTVLNNNFILWIGNANEASGVAGAIARALLWLADNFDLVAGAALAVVGAFAAVKAIGLAVELFSIGKALIALVPALASVGVALLANPMTLWALAITGAAVAVLALTGNLDGFVKVIGDTVTPILDAVGAMLGLKKESDKALEGGSDNAVKFLGDLVQLEDGTQVSADTFAKMSGVAADAGKTVTSEMEDATKSIQTLNSQLENAVSSFKELARMQAADGQGSSSSSSSFSISRAGGGSVHGPGTSRSDSIPAWLSNGEFVVQAKAVRRYGADFLRAINSGNLPKFALGGLVDGLTSGFSSSVAVPALSGTPSGSSGRPLTLVLDGETFGGLSAPDSVADKLARFAATRSTRRAGTPPNWYGGKK